MNVTLLNLSGGVDSTYCLWLHLTTSKEPLLVHHCRLRTYQNRTENEKRAVDAILALCREQGHRFEYIETGFDYGVIRPTYDTAIVAFFTAILLRRDKRIKTVIRSANKDDVTERVAPERNRIRDGIVKSLSSRTFEYVFPIRDMTKGEVYQALPEAFKPLVWWCRNGGERPCQRCISCRQMRRVIQ